MRALATGSLTVTRVTAGCAPDVVSVIDVIERDAESLDCNSVVSRVMVVPSARVCTEVNLNSAVKGGCWTGVRTAAVAWPRTGAAHAVSNSAMRTGKDFARISSSVQSSYFCCVRRRCGVGVYPGERFPPCREFRPHAVVAPDYFFGRDSGGTRPAAR